MTRRGRVAAAGNGEGSDDAELNVPDAQEAGVTEAPDQVDLADVNAARQRLLVKRAKVAEKPGNGDGRLG